MDDKGVPEGGVDLIHNGWVSAHKAAQENEVVQAIIVVKTKNSQVVDYYCGGCGARLESADEHHPEAFCTLVTAGYDPWEVTHQAEIGRNRKKKNVIPIGGEKA